MTSTVGGRARRARRAHRGAAAAPGRAATSVLSPAPSRTSRSRAFMVRLPTRTRSRSAEHAHRGRHAQYTAHPGDAPAPRQGDQRLPHAGSRGDHHAGGSPSRTGARSTTCAPPSPRASRVDDSSPSGSPSSGPSMGMNFYLELCVGARRGRGRGLMRQFQFPPILRSSMLRTHAAALGRSLQEQDPMST